MEIHPQLKRPRLSKNKIFRFDKLVNTRYFRESALHYIKHGKYTQAPPGHTEYKEFWDLEELKCRNGYAVGDLWIPGRMYFYLNYCPIKKIPDRDYLEFHPFAPKTKKVLTLPSFWEIDYAYWNAKEYGWQNSELGIPEVHMAILKTRRAGFSYKEAADGIYNYNFFPGSISTFYSATKTFLVEDGIFNKVEYVLNFLNQNTDWKKERRKVNNKFHKRASYEDGGDELGFMSELIAQVLDAPDKGRGGDSMKITFEEAGAFPFLLKAWEITSKQAKQGSTYTGQLSAFGTGGTKEDSHLEGLAEIFYKPLSYDCIAFDNVWDEGLDGTDCGFFCPVQYTYEEAMDVDGNVDIEEATKIVDSERARRKGSKNEKANIAESPKTPTEALQRSIADLFPVKEIQKLLLHYEKNPILTEEIQEGYFERYEDELRFKPMPKGEALNEYPPNYNGQAINSAIMIDEHPKKEGNRVPEGWYEIALDCYYKEQAYESDSVGIITVMKTGKCPYGIPNMPVAWFAGRPTKKSTFHKHIFELSDYYNAKIQSEIQGGANEVIEYAKKIKKVDRLHMETDIDSNKLKNNTMSYFMNMVTERKRSGLDMLSEWVVDVVGFRENGAPIYRYEKIKWKMLLMEMAKFRYEGNYDCISAMIIQMFMQKAREMDNSRDSNNIFNKKNSFFTRPKYGVEVEEGYDLSDLKNLR